MLEVRDAGFCYRPGQWVFRHHGFTVGPGRVLAILGPNGRGKTTLLKGIMGLVRLTEGQVRLDGAFGYVPQSHRPAFGYTVLDMVVMGRARHLGLFSAPGADDWHAARAALARVGVESFAERSFLELSGGEQQLVLIARALASDCRILILDEPTSALDFQKQDRVLLTVRAVVRELGLAVLFTTHYPSHALHVADDALLMFGPTDFVAGPVDAVMTDDNLSRLYGLTVRQLALEAGRFRTVVPVFS